MTTSGDGNPMTTMMMSISLRPGTAEVLQTVAKALGTSLEAIVAHHLETIKDAVNFTHGTKTKLQPMTVVLSDDCLQPKARPSLTRSHSGSLAHGPGAGNRPAAQ